MEHFRQEWATQIENRRIHILYNPNQRKGMFLTAGIKSRQGRCYCHAAFTNQTLKAMKILSFLLLVFTLHLQATTYSQKVTLSIKDASLPKVFKSIRQQTGYNFFYKSEWLRDMKPVTLNVQNVSIEEVLNLCFQNQPLTFEFIEKSVVIKPAAGLSPRLDNPRPVLTSEMPPINITGRIVNESGEPVAGASVKVKGTNIGTTTNSNGEFALSGVEGNATLVFSSTDIETFEAKVNHKTVFNLSATTKVNSLNEVVINKGYYTEKQRLSTGNVTRITAKEIEQQPVSNVLAALQGRVPGLDITQQTGNPGSGFAVQIRGKNSIFNGNDPFYVIDGVPYNSQIPFTSDGYGILNRSLALGNPLNYINTYDIESVEVLKDADATAIYGSRAANGAILITTKKGKPGPLRVNLSVNAGITRPSRDIQLLNTQQYLTMRHEAFKNDNKTPGPNDHDINGDWDTTRYTDWSKLLLNTKPVYADYEIGVSGGNTNTQWLFGAGYNRQSTGMPTLISGDGFDERPSIHFTLNSISANKRLKVGFTGSYSSDKNTVQTEDLSRDRFMLTPNAPSLYSTDGSLNWAPLTPGNAGTWQNPLSYLYVKSKILSANVIGNGNIAYSILPGLEFKASFGYTNTRIDQLNIVPTTAYDPELHIPSGSSRFGNTSTTGWIIEPQANYLVKIGKGQLNLLAGGSLHSNKNAVQITSANDFISDALLENPQAASRVTVENNASQYNYEAVFGRINYNWQDKYIVNLTARRDGSSRFGPGKQFGNFGSAGVAWIFSNEPFLEKLLPFLNYGKLRASYGTSGNDQIGDYQFLDLYRPSNYPYGLAPGLYPQNLFNTDLAWEIDKKKEVGIELGFLKDRITFQVSYYQNESNNQLVTTPISLVTGYSIIPSNFPALVRNSGLEMMVGSVNVKSKNFRWSSYFNITIPRNKLVSFPGFETSLYSGSNNLRVGQPITSQRVYHLTGVNDTTGLYQFTSSKGGVTSTPDNSTDRNTWVNTAPKFYGGFGNTFSYKGLSVDFLFQFYNQLGKNLFASYNRAPGNIAFMQPVEIFDNHWQKPGDHKKYQLFTQGGSPKARIAYNNATQSDFIYGDASYIRLKNVAISWQLPASWQKKIKMVDCRLFLRIQNLITITNYNGLDPETQSLSSPPKKVFTAGFQTTF